MTKITIAIDSFKGSISSREAAECFERGIRRVLPDCHCQKVVMGDGGEGTLDALVEQMGGSYVSLTVSDPLGRPIEARYGIIDSGTTAIIEMAAASGLPLLKPEERNPWLTSTYGTGEMVADALSRGCRRFLIAIGGSATNDGGTGMLRALGFRFLDANGEPLTGGGKILERIASIEPSSLKELCEAEFIVACDVHNPLYGAEGAAYIFAPQKGADAAMVEQLDRGLRNYAERLREFNGAEVAELPGAGAAGGLGGGLCALLGARLEPGVEMVLRALNFEGIVESSDLVVTGEGRIDRQTLMGKAPNGVLRTARRCGVPVVAICGSVTWCDELRESDFEAIIPISDEQLPLEEAMKPHITATNIERTAEKIALRLPYKHQNKSYL